MVPALARCLRTEHGPPSLVSLVSSSRDRFTRCRTLSFALAIFHVTRWCDIPVVVRAQILRSVARSPFSSAQRLDRLFALVVLHVLSSTRFFLPHARLLVSCLGVAHFFAISARPTCARSPPRTSHSHFSLPADCLLTSYRVYELATESQEVNK